MSETVEIRLSDGSIAIVDKEDEDLAKFKWLPLATGNTSYAICRMYPSRKTVWMHRLILQRKLDRSLGKREKVDHVNRYGLDNRRCNVRSATHTQNMRNTGTRSDNTSGYKGVHWDKRVSRWRARIAHDEGRKNLGSFSSAEDAARAYNIAAILYHGEFAWLNVIPDEAQS